MNKSLTANSIILNIRIERIERLARRVQILKNSMRKLNEESSFEVMMIIAETESEIRELKESLTKL